MYGVYEEYCLLSLSDKAATTAIYKRLLKRQARLEWIFTKMQKRRDEDVVDFKTMEIDHLLLDESQEFKNLQFDTRYNNVAGLGDPDGSQRALIYCMRSEQCGTEKIRIYVRYS